MIRPLRPHERLEVVADVSIGGRAYVGRGTLIEGDSPVAILTLTPRPAAPPFARAADVTDIEMETDL